MYNSEHLRLHKQFGPNVQKVQDDYLETSVIANSTCSILVHFCSKINISQQTEAFTFHFLQNKEQTSNFCVSLTKFD